MTAFQYREPKPPATLMREHIHAMRVYASELQNVLGFDNPIVKRIRSCAQTNELMLNRWEETASAAGAGTAETQSGSGLQPARATPEGGDALEPEQVT